MKNTLTFLTFILLLALPTLQAQVPEVDMVFVEGGQFFMGCTQEQHDDCGFDEVPTHLVVLDNFYISKYEVTQALWKAVMGNNPSKVKGDSLPVTRVSWLDARAFTIKLSKLTGKKYRLPTESEWEYAARGGRYSRGYKFSGSDNIDDVAWYRRNSKKTPHPVGRKDPNELGIYDMSGNVLEWCQDWYGSYNSSAQTNPQGPSSGSYRVYRGGSWYGGAGNCRSSDRYYDDPTIRSFNLGLRLAL